MAEVTVLEARAWLVPAQPRCPVASVSGQRGLPPPHRRPLTAHAPYLPATSLKRALGAHRFVNLWLVRPTCAHPGSPSRVQLRSHVQVRADRVCSAAGASYFSNCIFSHRSQNGLSRVVTATGDKQPCPIQQPNVAQERRLCVRPTVTARL